MDKGRSRHHISMSHEDSAIIAAAAEAEGLGFSTYVRSKALVAARERLGISAPSCEPEKAPKARSTN